MKHSKKLISVILAIIMIIGTASTAFAGAIDTTKSVDSLIEQENIANVAEYLLNNINSRKDSITGTVLRLVFLFLKNDDLNTFIDNRDVTKLTDEENAKILVNWLSKLLKDNTKSITEADWYNLAKAGCKFLGITLNLSDIDGAIKTLHDVCEKCANPGIVGRIVDFADLGKLNGKALDGVSIANNGNLGVVKALINWISDNTYVVKQVLMSKLDAGSLNDTIKTDEINAKVKSYIGKDAIRDKMYRLVCGTAQDGDFAKSMYSDYTADQLLAAGFIKMMKCVDATLPENKIEKTECNDALNMSVYQLIAKYGPVFLANYRFENDNKTIVEKLNTVLKKLVDDLKNEEKVDAETKARFDFKDFTTADFDTLFKNVESDGILNQFNNICCLVAKKMLSDAVYKELGLVSGGNENLNDNLTKICRYTLPAIAKVGTVGGVDFTAFTSDAVKNMSLAEMGAAVLKLFFPSWFESNFDNNAKTAVSNAKTIGQLAVIAAKLALTTDKWMDWAGENALKEPAAVSLTNISSMTSDECNASLLKMGAEVAAIALDRNSEKTHFTLDDDRKDWTYVTYLNKIVNWSVDFVKGVPAVLYCGNFCDDESNPFYKINVVINELVDFSFIDAGSGTFKLDIETLTFDKLLNNLFNLDLESVLNTFKKNDNDGNILNGSIVSGVVSVLDNAITALFEHDCDVVTEKGTTNLGKCVYQDYSYSYCKTNGHLVSALKNEGDKYTSHKYGNWQVVEAAGKCGATGQGLSQRVCSVCGSVNKKTILPSDQHNFAILVEEVAATTEKEGYKLWKCACGATEKDIIPKIVPTEITVTQTDHIKVNKDGVIIVDSTVAANAAAFGTNAKLVKGAAGTESKIATGMKLELTANEKTLTKEIAVIGDVDGNGEITVNDARTILRVAVALESLTGINAIACDVDFSGDISVGDARSVLRAAVGLEESGSWMAKYKEN